MTWLERLIARIGIAGLLALLLLGSVGLNLWQLRKAGEAEAACESRIAALTAEADRKSAKLETTALEISRDVTRDAEAEVRTIEVETVRYVDRIREVRIPVPAECHQPMPDGVQDALRDAARAANRFVPTG